MTRPRGGETGHEDIEIGVHGDVFLLVLIVDFHEVDVADGHVTDIQGVGTQETMEGLRVAEFHHLGLVETLPKLVPHGIQHHFGQSAESCISTRSCRTPVGCPRAPHTRGCTADAWSRRRLPIRANHGLLV